ncbi:hypothetical protein C2G38_2188780 [Gigaspora rosea]|uniref:Uncharacterized protein n=1 Tax=Gigaspora rosea TaxID=44941 RepID=A0A397V6E4_9GLOM|nr:hypothetical protein C2G38_2188780 [Gigaspora rosea]
MTNKIYSLRTILGPWTDWDQDRKYYDNGLLGPGWTRPDWCIPNDDYTKRQFVAGVVAGVVAETITGVIAGVITRVIVGAVFCPLVAFLHSLSVVDNFVIFQLVILSFFGI